MSDLELDLRDLSKEKFESLIHQLLVAKYPTAGITRVEGSGGDEGIDSFQGTLTIGPAIWQCKHFRERIREPQERQILKSVETAFSKRELSLWTLCLPINLRTEEHVWFQNEVVNKYGVSEKIKLMQAASIYTDLIIIRPLRDEFFPNSSLSNVLKLREILLKTNLLSAEEKARLAAEYAQQYIADPNIDPRLTASVHIGAKPPQAIARIPGAIMSVYCSAPCKTRQLGPGLK